MKRLGTSLTALTLSGVLAAAIAPAASASDAVSASQATEAVAAGAPHAAGDVNVSDVRKSGTVQSVTYGGQTYYAHNDRVHWVKDASRINETLTEEEVKNSNDFVKIVEEQKKSDVAAEVKAAEEEVKAAEKRLEEAKAARDGSGKSTCLEGDFNADGVVDAADDKMADTNGDGTVSAEEKAAAQAKANENCASGASSERGLNGGEIAGIVVPATLVIGGIAWYLNQDGRTYVTDMARTSSKPTDSEKEASEQMLAANKDAVATQARGMAAETGSNTAARIAFALLVMALFGAAFAVRRRLFA